MSNETESPSTPSLFSLRAVGLTLLVLVLAVGMAWASVVFRKTKLERTRQFLGPEAIHAIQSGPIVMLEYLGPRTLADLDAELQSTTTAQALLDGESKTELSGTPGLGMFRRGLLDERHYQWDTVRQTSVEELTDESGEFVILEFSDDPRYRPPDHSRAEVEPTKIMLELKNGWVGLPGQGRVVRLTDRAQPAIRNFIVTRKDIRSRPAK